MFEYDDEAQRWNAVHHPFTAPKDGHEDLTGHRPRALHRQGLRHGAQRLGARRRLGAYPPRGGAEQGVPRAEDRRRGGARPSSASCSTRCSTARRRTAASRSASTASSTLMTRRRVDPRRDRLPEDAARAGPADQRAEPGRREAAARAAHPAAQPRPAGSVHRAGDAPRDAARGARRERARYKIPESVLVVIHTPALRRAADRARRPARLLAERHRLEGRASTSRSRDTCVREVAEETGIVIGSRSGAVARAARLAARATSTRSTRSGATAMRRA